jgi:DNA-binding beta-propeller fold protein YncE
VTYTSFIRLALDAQGNIYATDYADSHIVKLDAKLRLRRQLGVFGTTPQLLAIPFGIAVDPKGNVYVTDPINGRLQKRSATGQVLAAFGRHAFAGASSKRTLGQFSYPVGIAVAPRGAIYVSDQPLGQIQELSDRGPIKVIRLPGVQRWIAVDRQGALYVMNVHNLVEKLAPNGASLATLGPPEGFNRPEGLAVDSQNNVYVVDTGNNRAVELSPTGARLAVFGETVGLSRPEGIAVDIRGNVYVADTGHDRIVEFSARGDLLATLGAAVHLHSPQGVAVDRHDNLYVADASNNRIVKLSAEGKVVAIWD